MPLLLSDVERADGASRQYWKDRARYTERVLAAVLLQVGPVRIAEKALDVLDGSCRPFYLDCASDPLTTEWIFSARRK